MRSLSLRLFRLLMVATVAFAPAPALAQREKTPPLVTLSLEDLMKIEIEPVFGASRRLQPVLDAPASVTIITADDIARHGYHSLADILRGVRGFSTTNDRNYTYIGVGGFAIPGDYNTRILLLVDGHRMNDNIYEQAQAGLELGLDTASFERVEVIRGPASSLYGTNAFFGVVNVITKSGASLTGARMGADTGSFGEQTFRASVGRKFREDVDVVLFANATGSDGTPRLYFPEFDAPETLSGVAAGMDDESMRQVSAKLHAGRFTLSSAFGVREKSVPTAAFGTEFGDPSLRTTDARFFVDGQYDRAIGDTHVNVHAFGDRYRYDGAYPFAEGGLYRDYADGVWIGAESRVSRPMGERHSLIAGGEWRYNLRQGQGGKYVNEPQPDFTLDTSSSVVAAYVQDEYTVTKHLTLNAGVRLDAYSSFRRAAPRLGVIVKPTRNEAIKYLYGNAFRAPNAYEVYYFTPEGAQLAPETINTHEVVWERYTGHWLRTSVSGYINRVHDLISVYALSDSDFRFMNRDRVNGAGLGFEAEVRMASRVKLLANYVRQTASNPATGERLANSPQNAGAMQLTTNGPGRVEMALDARATGARSALDGSTVPSFVVVDTTARRAIGKGLTLTAAARNLFNQRYADPGSEEHRQVSIPQDGRTWRVGLEWSVGGR